MDGAMVILRVVLALLLLLLGRRLFWLAVGVLGFVTTADIVTDLVAIDPAWLVWVIAIAVGLVGALLAVFLQRLAAGMGGFLAAFYLVYGLLAALDLGAPSLWVWVLAVVAGVVGAVLAFTLLDWAIIVLTSLAGASLLVQIFALDQPLALGVFLVAAAVGIAVQARTLRPPHRPPPHDPLA